jgi:magnesium chelatase family protein
MQATIFSATTMGVNASEVLVEVDVSLGLINFFIVGLPDAAIRESKQRIQTALKNCGIKLPDRKITVNLAPANIKKEGTLFDVPIALGVLQAAHVITIDQQLLQETVVLGELSLDGSIRPVRGVLPIAHDVCGRLGKKRLIVPQENAAEAALVSDCTVIGVANLLELVEYLQGTRTIEPTTSTWQTTAQQFHPDIDFAQVKGQTQAKRALQIAAAGHHNVLFVGSPGAGKTMLAQRLATIMPPLTTAQAIAATKVYSVAGKLDQQQLVARRPFRAPHHTTSQAGLIGGGTFPQPGEVSLAHHGILFLDELTEFKRTVIEALRQPIEHGVVTIARAQQTITFPASFLLVAALNPCPCGFFGEKRRTCSCSSAEIQRYLSKLSGPFLDRIDIQVYVPALEYETINDHVPATGSQRLYAQVERAVARQHKRLGAQQCNAAMNPTDIERWCTTTPAAECALRQAFDALALSMRGYHKILKIARTIADLDDSEVIELTHVQEAILYRSLDQTLQASIKF